MQCVKKYMNKLEDLKKIMDKYALDTSDISDMMKEMKYFRVTVPIIGNFSTGKSSLINATLGKQLLSVDITPETAVPTEIYYGNNRVLQYVSDEERPKELTMEDLPLKELTIRDADLVKIELENEFLKDIINVKIVDLPGFDSGIEFHNLAIDKYIPNSLAYILAVAVDEPVLKDNIEDFLTELDLHELPLYIILTKSARISESEVQECKNLINTIVKKIIKNAEIKIGTTESYGKTDVEDFKSFLSEIQSNAVNIFESRYSEKIIKEVRKVEMFFIDQLNKKDMSLSELDVERENLNAGIYDLLSKMSKERLNFEKQTEECILTIRKKIYSDLEGSLPGISAMIQNGKNVNDRVNTIVRNAVAIGIKTEFEPRLQKYLKRISEMLDVDILNDEGIKMNIEKILTDNMIYDITRRIIPFALAAVGCLAGVVGIAIGALIGIFIDSTINISQSKIKEAKAKEVSYEIINTVSEQAADAVAKEIRNYLVQINQDMEREIYKQKELLDKSLEDVEMRLALETKDRRVQVMDIEGDLNVIRDLMLL